MNDIYRSKLSYDEFSSLVPYARRTFDQNKLNHGIEVLINIYEILNMKIKLSVKKRIYYANIKEIENTQKDLIWEMYIKQNILEKEHAHAI